MMMMMMMMMIIIIIIIIIIYYLFLFLFFYCFLTSTPVILNFFCKAVLLFLKGSISSSFWYLL